MAIDPSGTVIQQPFFVSADPDRDSGIFVCRFQLVTLPVEFNASRRAVQILGESGMLLPDELSMTKKVLRAAALTYVAGAASAILQLLRIILLTGGRRRE